MKTANKPSLKKAWANVYSQPAQEFPTTPLKVISGSIPEGLRGSLYRNGPGRLQRGTTRVGHWFDGDGAILGVHFSEAGATGVYRYVQTAGYKEEEIKGEFLFGNYGMTAPGPVWNQWLKPIKNAANTSVLALSDKLLALWEGGNPHALDLLTLETIGLDNLSQLEAGTPYSAHPKIDPKTGEIFNFGIAAGINAILRVYKSDATGKIIKQNSVQLEGLPSVHDFAMAGQYLIFFVPPVRVNLLPVVMGLSSFSDALEWQANKATQILIFDKETLDLVSRSEAEPWFQWHFGNSYVDKDGAINVDFVRYPDFQTNQYLKEVATGETHTKIQSSLWRSRFNPHTGEMLESTEVFEKNCEFPVIPSHTIGEAASTYLVVHRDGVDPSKEMYNAIAKLDSKTDTVTIADLGENRYPSEALYVADALNHQHGWIITVVYDGNLNTSEVVIFDSNHLNEESVCRLGLPAVIPHSFHGTWQAR